jgi:hypothetical protein
MANKYMNKCLTSLATKELQIKTTLRFHLIAVRMGIFKRKNNCKYYEYTAKQESYTLLVGMQTSATIKESSLGIPQKAEERTAK